jgi:uncharacterized GH25 family protein
MNASRRAVRPLFSRAMRFGLPTLIFTANAQAHMPYLLPNTFDATARDHVSVIASFTEMPFVADVVMKSERYAVITPGGKTLPITQVNYLQDLAAFEVATVEEGVYRITSGERLGRKSRMYAKTDGSWEFIGEHSDVPANVQVVEVQSVTTADVYVVHGAANATALTPTGVGIELKLLSSPALITARLPMQAELLFQGKPLADAEVTFYRGALDSMGGGLEFSRKSDAHGKLVFTVPVAGTYLALIRHRTESPAGAETPWRSYTYTLTFAAQ